MDLLKLAFAIFEKRDNMFYIDYDSKVDMWVVYDQNKKVVDSFIHKADAFDKARELNKEQKELEVAEDLTEGKVKEHFHTVELEDGKWRVYDGAGKEVASYPATAAGKKAAQRSADERGELSLERGEEA